MPRIVDREDMQRTVLTGAMKAFTAKGYHAATIADVAAAAGLGKGTLYLYFKNKEAIAEAMVASYFRTIEDQFVTETLPLSLDEFVDRLSHSMDVTEDDARFIRVFFEVFGPSFGSDGFAAGVAGFFDRLGAHYAAQLAHLQAIGAVRSDVNTDTAGRMLAACVDGMRLHQGLFSIPDARGIALRADAVGMMARGLAAPGGACPRPAIHGL
jgi:AcrR family transcriptional regulator